MNGVRSNEIFDIGGGPVGRRIVTVDESGVVVEERKPVRQEFLEAFPITRKRGLR